MRMDSEGYSKTGDRHMGIGPQDPNLIAGKVLRIDGDGNAHPEINWKATREFIHTDTETFKVLTSTK